LEYVLQTEQLSIAPVLFAELFINAKHYYVQGLKKHNGFYKLRSSAGNMIKS